MSEKFTTPGAIQLKHAMPTKLSKDSFDLYTPLDKDGVKKVVTNLLRDGGENAVHHINTLGQQFFNHATEIGATTPLSDYVNESDERQAIIDEYSGKVHDILRVGGKKSEVNDKLQALTGNYNGKIAKQNMDYLVARGSTAAKMAKSGARGNPNQLASGTSTPLMAMNVKGELVPVIIEHSFAQGMSPAEQIALSYMGRGNTVLAQLSTSLPGALFKKLGPTVFHEVVTIDDCGTHNGIQVKAKDKQSIVGRYLQGTKTLIDEAEYKRLTMSPIKFVNVRSAMTCEAKDGVCQYCFGLMAHGRLPEIGTNVGVIAAQSVSEVLTQGMLSTKHKATAGERGNKVSKDGERQRKGSQYDQASNLLNTPNTNFKDEATLSTLNGKVTAIKETPFGDFNVFVNEKSHFVPISQQVHVDIGEDVKIGDTLSTGTPNPRTLVNLRGIGAGRAYMANELRGIYGSGLDPRHFEVIAKNLLKYVIVLKSGATPFLPGEKVEVNAIRKYLATGAKELPVSKAEGQLLAKGVAEFTPGTLLDANHIQELKDQGIKTVSISDTGLVVEPIVPGLQTAKMLDKNWVSKLSFNKLRDTLKESAAIGAESEIHSTDPITSYMFGSEFGEGENGKY